MMMKKYPLLAGVSFSLGLLTTLSAQVTWDGGGDPAMGWEDPINFSSDAALTGVDDVVLDGGSGIYHDVGTDLDVDIPVTTNHTINSLTIQGDFTTNLNGAPATTSKTHQIADASNNVDVITIDGLNASGKSIEFTGPNNGFNHNVEIDTKINFTGVNPVIRNNSDGSSTERLNFNRDVTAAGLNVTLSAAVDSGNEAIRFVSNRTTSWSSTTIEQGAILFAGGGAGDATLGDAGSTVTMGSGNTVRASLISDPTNGVTHTNSNNFVLGTTAHSRLRVGGGNLTNEAFELSGSITGGATNRDLDLDADNNDILLFTSTSTINIDSRIDINGTGTDEKNSRVRFDGTITAANGGVVLANDADTTVDGSGTIIFELADGSTAGADNFGGNPWDVQANLDVTSMTADFNITGTLTQDAYILIDYGSGSGNLMGGSSFTGKDVPAGYVLDHDYNSGTQVALVLIPEPSIFSLIALAGFGLIFRRRR